MTEHAHTHTHTHGKLKSTPKVLDPEPFLIGYLVGKRVFATLQVQPVEPWLWMLRFRSTSIDS